MAVITISRQVAAHGDEVAQALSKKTGYRFITRQEIEKRIVELGFPESKLGKYDERKPGFFASMAKDRDLYLNLSQYAMLEAAVDDNCIFIGRGAFAVFYGLPNHFSARIVADEKTRLARLEKEFSWSEKQAKQRISESDSNRDGFHKNFYNVDVSESSNYNLVLNTGFASEDYCAEVIANYINPLLTQEKEAEGKEKLKKMLVAQSVVNKLITEKSINIQFVYVTIEDKTLIVHGVADSIAPVEQALSYIKKDLPDFEVQSAVSIINDFKMYR
ncbi:MAG: cytidylate kinase-like family protein [Treponema sp.]|nr:cytidylate kinase-like family protein [Treponema sp.]